MMQQKAYLLNGDLQSSVMDAGSTFMKMLVYLCTLYTWRVTFSEVYSSMTYRLNFRHYDVVCHKLQLLLVFVLLMLNSVMYGQNIGLTHIAAISATGR